MSTEEIKVGDEVRLKSGGTPMTVESIDSDGSISCVWWDGKGYQKFEFSADMLRLDE